GAGIGDVGGRGECPHGVAIAQFGRRVLEARRVAGDQPDIPAMPCELLGRRPPDAGPRPRDRDYPTHAVLPFRGGNGRMPPASQAAPRSSQFFRSFRPHACPGTVTFHFRRPLLFCPPARGEVEMRQFGRRVTSLAAALAMVAGPAVAQSAPMVTPQPDPTPDVTAYANGPASVTDRAALIAALRQKV